MGKIVDRALEVRRRRWSAGWKFKPLQVRVEPKTIHLGQRPISREAITDARVIVARKRRFVRLRRAGGLADDIAVHDVEEGRALLQALAFGGRQRAVRFEGRAPWMANDALRVAHTIASVFLTIPLLLSFVTFIAFLFLVPHGPAHVLWPAAIFGALLAAFGLLTLAAMPSTVDVGADGLRLKWLWRRRFIPLASIDTIKLKVGSPGMPVPHVCLRGGTELVIPLRDGENGSAAFVERLNDVREGFSGSDPSAVGALLERRGRDVPEWLSDLRTLGAGANADLRTAPVHPDQLWAIVESPSARPAERAAAAVALAPSFDDAARQRVRIAVRATADEDLRAALEAASESDAGATEEALRRLST